MVRHAVKLWPWLLTLIVLAPVLAPGYVLTYDMVFVPHQPLRLDLLGLGTGHPRAVPSDGVVSVLSLVVPGWLIQKVVLIAALGLAGEGARRLLAGRAVVAQLVAATWAVWNPYVAERLAMGQWAQLVSYAAFPWLVLAARRWREGAPRAGACLALGGLMASFSPQGGMVAVVLVLPLVWWPGLGSRTTASRAWMTAVLLAVQLPWIVSGLVAPVASASTAAAAEAFAAQGDGSLGPLVSLLTLGGVWNAQAVPASRESVLAWVWALVVLAGLVVGLRSAARDRWFRVLLGSSVAVLALAGLSAVLPALTFAAASEHLPGLALLRDGSRAVGGLVVAQVVLLGVAAEVVVSRLAQSWRPVLATVVVLVPIAAVPDLAWGLLGRLEPVSYPAVWQRADAAVGDGRSAVLVVPANPYRAFRWNPSGPVLDPAGRWFSRPTWQSEALSVDARQVDPEVPTYARALRHLERGDRSALAAAGVGRVVATADVRHWRRVADRAGLRPVLLSSDLAVWRVPGAVAPARPAAWSVGVLGVAWLCWGGLFAGAAVACATRWRVRTGQDPTLR